MQDLRRIIWLASYPKSGNTWLRSLLAHYFLPTGQAPDINNLRRFTTGDVRRDFYDAASGGQYLGKSLEDWMRVRPEALRLIAASKPGKHFVKTHCKPVHFLGMDIIPPEVTAGAIYMVRNPFDVAPSLARHLSVDIDEAIRRMCDPDTIMGSDVAIYETLGRWDEHVIAWTTAPGLPRHVIRYEDLLARPGPTMQRLLDFMSVTPDRPKLAKAINATRFEVMKKAEEKLGFIERPKGMQSFFARGRAGAWREDLTQEQALRLRDEFRPVLQRWYPEILTDVEDFCRSN